MIEIHCLKCDHVWGEEESPDICPSCGNTDKQQTVYQTNQKENTIKTYTQNEINAIADAAFNHAILHIQDHLGQTDGGVAGIYFSGNREKIVLDILKSYIRTEIEVTA
jgi:hypothetical protein